MNYKEKKRSMFLGLPWTFTSYTITDEIITVDSGLLRKEENDCYLYKVIDVRLECTLMERIFGLGTVHCFWRNGKVSGKAGRGRRTGHDSGFLFFGATFFKYV